MTNEAVRQVRQLYSSSSSKEREQKERRWELKEACKCQQGGVCVCSCIFVNHTVRVSGGLTPHLSISLKERELCFRLWIHFQHELCPSWGSLSLRLTHWDLKEKEKICVCEHKATNPPFLTPINLLGRVCVRPHLSSSASSWYGPVLKGWMLKKKGLEVLGRGVRSTRAALTTTS